MARRAVRGFVNPLTGVLICALAYLFAFIWDAIALDPGAGLVTSIGLTVLFALSNTVGIFYLGTGLTVSQHTVVVRHWLTRSTVAFDDVVDLEVHQGLKVHLYSGARLYTPAYEASFLTLISGNVWARLFAHRVRSRLALPVYCSAEPRQAPYRAVSVASQPRWGSVAASSALFVVLLGLLAARRL